MPEQEITPAEAAQSAKRMCHVCMPTRGAIAVCTHAYLNYYTTWGQRAGMGQLHQHLPCNKPVVAAREECVDIVRAWRDKFPDKEHWVLWMDDDMDPPMSAVAVMRAEIEASEKETAGGERPHPIGLLSGLCCRKEPNDIGMVFAPKSAHQLLPIVDYLPGEIVEVKWCGIAFALMRADWLDKLTKPYFEGDDKGVSEDNYFVHKLREAGCIPYVHTGLSIGHFDIKVQHSFFAYMPQKVRSSYDKAEPVAELRFASSNPQTSNGKVEAVV